jgi:hypothetical protein
MTIEDIEEFGRFFASYEYQAFGLTSMAAMLLRLPRRSTLTQAMHSLDTAVIARFPLAKRYAQYVVACVTA